MSNATSSPDYGLQLAGVILTGVYVAATLALVVITIWLSKATLAASDKHSQDAIRVVQDQIKASEKQSQAAIDAIHEQIEENKNQTLETIYNQQRPLLVCAYHPIADTSLKNIPLPITTWGRALLLILESFCHMPQPQQERDYKQGLLYPVS